MIQIRYLTKNIVPDLRDKMVFLGGPRQVGKTTLALQIGREYYQKPTYFNWDSAQDRKSILEYRYEAGSDLIIFDEIHKYQKWKNHLKGEYDKHREKFHILVTGSARLDFYRRGGDSLMGRYYYYRLHPFSLAEILEMDNEIVPGENLIFPESEKRISQSFQDLFEYGGFPEPFLKKNKRALRRFHNHRLDRLVKEDIRDVEAIRDISSLQILVDILPEKVGSLLSLNSLREDLQVTHNTIYNWADVLERFYYHFRIYPFAFTTIKSLRKEPKLYLWDWSQLKQESVRLENMIASHLLKLAHYLYDVEGYKIKLHFLRDREKREVDFVVTLENQPWFAVEVKSSPSKPTRSMKYYRERLDLPYFYQVVGESGHDYWQGDFRMISADKFLAGLV